MIGCEAAEEYQFHAWIAEFNSTQTVGKMKRAMLTNHWQQPVRLVTFSFAGWYDNHQFIPPWQISTSLQLSFYYNNYSYSSQ